jgi:hypothetical protein
VVADWGCVRLEVSRVLRWLGRRLRMTYQ